MPLMQWYVEEEGMSVNAASKQVHLDSGGVVSATRAYKVYQNRKGSLPRGKRKPNTDVGSRRLSDSEAAQKKREQEERWEREARRESHYPPTNS